MSIVKYMKDLWTKLYAQVPSIAQMSEEDILPLGYFTPETFPKREKLTLVGNDPQMLKLDMTFPSILCEKCNPADWAVAKEAHLSETFPTELGVCLSSCIERIQKLRNADG